MNFLISLATVFASEKIWALYNGFISYFLVGTFFYYRIYSERGKKERLDGQPCGVNEEEWKRSLTK